MKPSEMTLREFLAGRGITQEAAGVLGGVDASTISRICAGQVHPRPATVVALARALGVSPKRMKAMCDAHYIVAHPGESPAELLVRDDEREVVSA
jgi:transcriptional regulator with XRE-family HTH domain